MFRFKNEKGLTLIELLITISVLAVVSAIALPVINNVVTSSNSNALTQTIKDADDFIAKYSKSGVVVYDGLRTLSGYVDADGDNTIDANEKIDTLTLNEKYSMSATGSAQVGGQYSNGGVTAATITSAGSNGSSTPATGGITGLSFSTAFDGTWYGSGTEQDLTFVSYNASTRTLVLTEPRNGMCMWDFYIFDTPTKTFKGSGSGGYGNTIFGVTHDGVTCTYTADFNVIEANTSGLVIDPTKDTFLITAGSYLVNKPFTLN